MSQALKEISRCTRATKRPCARLMHTRETLSDRRNERRAAHERVKIRLKESFSSVNAQIDDDNQLEEE